MLALQDPGEFDVSSLIKKIVNGLVVFFFIGLPILKGLMESRKERKAKERKRAGVELDEPAPQSTAETAHPSWEELLRGDAPDLEPTSAPTPPLPTQAGSRVPTTGTLVSLDTDAPPMLSEENLESEGANDEEALAAEAIARREREEILRQHEIVRRQREAGSPQRASVEPEYVAGTELPGGRAGDLGTAAPSVISRRIVRSRMPRTHLAHAIVMSEILGPPVGLDPSGERRASRPLSM